MIRETKINFNEIQSQVNASQSMQEAGKIKEATVILRRLAEDILDGTEEPLRVRDIVEVTIGGGKTEISDAARDFFMEGK